MNYRHIYHAANFADVFKHWILTLLLQKLIEKPTAFCVLDTHAGVGLYNLNSPLPQKTLEQNSGVQKLVNKKLATAFTDYWQIVKNLNKTSKINVYPGSPKFIQYYLRMNDRLILAELHKDDVTELQANFADDRNVKIIAQDGYTTIKAVLPPDAKRGLVLIDPPFESDNEFAAIIKGLEDGIKRFAHGIYAIWYPIKELHQVKKFYNKIKNLGIKKALLVELHANELVATQLNACGMVIINPPWQLDTQLQENLPLLLEYLEFSRGTFKLEWLVTE